MSTPLVDSPGTLRPLLRLSMPVLAEQILHLMVEFVDMGLTAIVLRDASYLAAMTTMMYVLWLVGNLFAFVSYGSTALVARFVGGRDLPLANRVMNQSLTAGLAWSGALMLVGIPFAGPLVGLMGLEGAAADAAQRYLVIELWVLPAVMVERVGIACLRGAGDTVSGLAVMAIVNVINVGASYALVVGAAGAPELGWDGVALGTAIGHMCGAAIILALLVGGRASFRLRPRLMKPQWTLTRRILRIGVPGGVDAIMVVVCHLAYLRVINGLGDVAAAAHGIAIQVEALAFMPGAAFQIAASTLTGQYLGAGDPQRATRSVLVACGVAVLIMTTAGVFFFFAGEPLVAILFQGDDHDIVPLAGALLKVVAVVMAPLAVTMVLAGALRGAGDTRWPLAFTIIGMLLVRAPLAAYLAQDSIALPLIAAPVTGLGLGVMGAWYAAAVDITLRSVLMVGRFCQGGWRHVEV